MIIERVWAMPNHRTFEIKPIKKLIEEEFGTTNYQDDVVDPFPFEGKVDCFDYFKLFHDASRNKGLLDPPYTKRQVSEHYKKNGGICTGWHTSSGWIAKVKDEMLRVIEPGGKVITFSYNSGGMGKTRGFELTRILLVCHGAEHNDTICTVESKRGYYNN